jgi:hypothetical protein
MRVISFLVLTICLQMGRLQSQVLAPAEITDDSTRGLQQKYFFDLKTIANNVNGHSFPYHFYFSRVLDLSERQQQSSDQRSIQFDHFQGKMILKATGNYFASYSEEAMDREQRARQTFTDVMMPILRAAVVQFHEVDVPDSYALEISHHVRKKLLGVVTEGVENVVLVVPKQSASDLVSAADVAHQDVALQKASAFVDGKPITFWASEEPAVAANHESPLSASPPPVTPQPVTAPQLAVTSPPAALHQPAPPSATSPASTADVPATGASLTLEKLQEQYRPDLDRMVRELDAQAHFVTYAAPAFIEFHKGRSLQLSIVTTLSDQSAGSQYQLAAFAFDKHITHLIRPVLSYLKNARDFDGVDFSTTIRLGKDSNSESKLAVEYLFPLNALRSYEGYDCTGQQLLDASIILINGERVGLNLQAAENR